MALRADLAVVAAGPGGALGFDAQLAGDAVAARVRIVALLDGAAVALLAVLDDAVAARPEVRQLRSVHNHLLFFFYYQRC